MTNAYKPYRAYKDSGVEWLGKIPEGWEIKKLKHLAKIKNGQDYKSVQSEAGYPVLGSGGQYTFASQYLYDSESVLLGRKGTIDKPLYINEPFWTVDTMYYTEVKKHTPGKYLYYLALTIQFDKYSTNTALPSMTQEHLNHYSFSVPKKFEEKEKIANFRDHETARIDALIAKQKSLKDSGVEWLGEVPAHWDIKRLKHIIAHLESGVSVNASNTPADTNEIGVLKTSCVYTRAFRSKENKTVFTDEINRVKCPVRKGAIIVSRMNTPELVGASALVEDSAPNLFLPDRLWQTVFTSEENQEPKFISYFMMIKGFRKQISLAAEGASSSMQNIAKEDYLFINILLPSLEEQKLIVKYVDFQLEKIDLLIKRAQEAINLIKERRTALISAAALAKLISEIGLRLKTIPQRKR